MHFAMLEIDPFPQFVDVLHMFQLLPPGSSGGQICATEDARIMEDVTMPNRLYDRWEVDRLIYDKLGPTKIGGFPPKSSISIGFSWVFHYKPSILGYPYFWKHPYGEYTIFDRVSYVTDGAGFLPSTVAMENPAFLMGDTSTQMVDFPASYVREYQMVSRWWQLKYFLMFIPKIGERIKFDEHIFQMGWNKLQNLQTN